MSTENKTITLDCIAGYPDLKKEGKKFIYILTHYDDLKEKGAYIPKGLILTGAPGVGKTMFAKAIANESNLPFFELKVEEDNPVESIHNAFNKAKENRPSILFVDELESLLNDDNFMSDESRKVTQAFLTELDGSENSEGVFVIATANILGTLPDPIIRSGRMDKSIMVDMPNLASRAAILEYYYKKIRTKSKINYRSLAFECEGMTGADIKNLVNDTYIECESQGIEITQKELEKKIPEILFRDMKKKNSTNDEKVICYHELGHLLVNYLLTGEYGSVSLERFGSAGGHVTTFSRRGTHFHFDGFAEDDDDEESLLTDKDQFMDRIAIALGGKAGEKVFLDKEYSGARDDIVKAVDTVHQMCRLGMFGFEYVTSRDPRQLTRKVLELIEEKKNEVLNQQYQTATNLLSQNRGLVEFMATKLLKLKSLSHEEVKALIDEYKANH